MGNLETAVVIGAALYLGHKLTRKRGSRSVSRGKRAARPIPSRKHDSDDLARRIERGEIRGQELADLMSTGKLRFRRNPDEPKNLNPSDRKELAKAKRLAKQFHGSDAGHVVELEPHERKLGRFGVIAGELTDYTYSPRAGSKRGGYKWRHESGDKGNGKPRGKHAPLLVVDAKTGKPQIVKHKSSVKFSSKRGFVG